MNHQIVLWLCHLVINWSSHFQQYSLIKPAREADFWFEPFCLDPTLVFLPVRCCCCCAAALLLVLLCCCCCCCSAAAALLVLISSSPKTGLALPPTSYLSLIEHPAPLIQIQWTIQYKYSMNTIQDTDFLSTLLLLHCILAEYWGPMILGSMAGGNGP